MNNIQGLINKYKEIPDERFFDEVFAQKEYEAISDKKADIVIDVGACAGEFSAYIYDRAQVIFALEPFPPHFSELEQNIREFGLTKIKAYKVALSSSNELQHFTNSGTRGANQLADSGNDTILVRTMTLASFIKTHNIPYVDILKIDIEGGEDQVFRSSDFPKVSSRIGCIIGEHLGSVQDILQKNGFRKIILPGNMNTLYEA